MRKISCTDMFYANQRRGSRLMADVHSVRLNNAKCEIAQSVMVAGVRAKTAIINCCMHSFGLNSARKLVAKR